MEARTQKGTASGAVAGHEGMLVKIEAGTKVEDAGEMIPQLIAKMFKDARAIAGVCEPRARELHAPTATIPSLQIVAQETPV